MSAAEREEFLAGVHIGVLSAAAGTAGRTLAVPVWYSYQPGGLLTALTGRRSRKAAAVRAACGFSLCVQDDSPPYRYVSVEGPVVSEEELIPLSGLRWRAATWAPVAVTVTSRTTRTRAQQRGVPDAPGALAQSGSGQGTNVRIVLPRADTGGCGAGLTRSRLAAASRPGGRARTGPAGRGSRGRA